MEKNDVIANVRQQLSDTVSDFQPPPFHPLNVSPWIAMSAMQKAIRRGREQVALRAAATLLHIAPERLWRRIGCIAFEDIGVADLETVGLVTAALTGKRFRESLGGPWQTASFLVCRMLQAQKCRATDDLLLVTERHPCLNQERSDYANFCTEELIGIATRSEWLPIRALAAWYAVGTNRRPSQYLKSRPGNPTALFDALNDADMPATVVEIAREGLRKVSEVLCPFVALLSALRETAVATAKDDEFPPESMIGDFPGWALDTYTREGRLALQVFLSGQTESARWVRTHIPPRQRVSFLGDIAFRCEGGLVRSRLRWSMGDELRRLVDFECNGPHCPDATEILNLMRADIPALNRVRAELMGV